MQRLMMTLGLVGLIACQTDVDEDLVDGGLAADAGPQNGERIPEMQPPRLPDGVVEIACDDDDPAQITVEIPADTEVPAATLVIRFDAGIRERQGFAIDDVVTATWIQDGVETAVADGFVRVDRWDVEGRLYGIYRLTLADAREVAGDFMVEAQIPEGCDAPEPDPGVLPPGECGGDYYITDWIADEAEFGLHYFNEMLATQLFEETLMVRLRVAGDPLALTWTDLDGANPDPQVPASDPIPLIELEGGFETAEPGTTYVHFGPSSYDRAFELVLEMHFVEIDGQYEANCNEIAGRLDFAFLDEGFSIPGQNDIDIDGDGTLDGYQIRGRFRASR